MEEEWEEEMLLDGEGSTPDTPTEARAAARARHTERRTLERLLFAHLFRAECPPSLTLGEWRLGLLSDEQAATVHRHLTTCPHCEEELTRLTAALKAPLAPAAPADRSGLRRIVLRLEEWLAPGGPALAPVALRGDSHSACYAGGDFLLSLTRQHGRGGIALLGSLIGSAEAGSARLVQGTTIVQEAPLTASATFAFDAVRPGAYQLVVTLAEAELIVPELVLEP